MDTTWNPTELENALTTDSLSLDTTGKTHVTSELQALIDRATAEGRVARITRGRYLVAPLNLGSGARLYLDEGAVLVGTCDEERIDPVKTRVAGIDAYWYPGVVNVVDARDVHIGGEGMIDGQGPYWWRKYWGADMSGGMRKDYDAKGLRWACDYDCMRPRNLVVMSSSEVCISGITLFQSGFWNLHICYSDHVKVSGVRVDARGKNSPSTDGIDIDSSSYVVVEKCELACNDDNIAIKSGRDADGWRRGLPAHHITIRECTMLNGFGTTIGSEVSGGIHDIVLENLTYKNTDCGFRIKSSMPRKGYIKDVEVRHLRMENVRYPFHICLDWNRGYSLCALPEGYTGPVSPVWEKLLDTSQLQEPNTQLSHIVVSDVVARRSSSEGGSSRAFNIQGFADSPIKDLTFEHVKLDCTEFGVIEHVEALRFADCEVSAQGAYDADNDDYDNR